MCVLKTVNFVIYFKSQLSRSNIMQTIYYVTFINYTRNMPNVGSTARYRIISLLSYQSTQTEKDEIVFV